MTMLAIKIDNIAIYIVDNYCFERAESFTCLCSPQTWDNNVSKEIRTKLITANRLTMVS